MKRALAAAARSFDSLDRWWTRPASQQKLANLLLVVFLVAMVVIELGRQGWLPGTLAARVPKSHFHALHTVFTLLLLLEVIGLVFGIARSVANAAGQQLEILSLILLRQSFKELTFLPEPIAWAEVRESLPFILSDSIGALVIFALLSLYYRLQRHRPISQDQDEQVSFVHTKKLIGLLLLAGLPVIGVMSFASYLRTGVEPPFFASFYTCLIFADVLLVLVSLRYSTAYHIVFRYFGFAVATVLVRLALTAPHYYDAAIGIGAALFALALTLAFNTAVDTFETIEPSS